MNEEVDSFDIHLRKVLNTYSKVLTENQLTMLAADIAIAYHIGRFDGLKEARTIYNQEK